MEAPWPSGFCSSCPHPPHLTSLTHLSHLATSPLSPTCPTLPYYSPSPTFPILLPHLFPPPVPTCHLTPLSPTFPTLPPHLPALPFPPCHLTSLPTFPTSPLFHLSQLALMLRDLTVAINITTDKISHNLTKAQPFPCNTSLWVQIPHTSN